MRLVAACSSPSPCFLPAMGTFPQVALSGDGLASKADGLRVCRREGKLCRGLWVGWINGLQPAVSISTRGGAGCCSWLRTTPHISKAWGRVAGKLTKELLELRGEMQPCSTAHAHQRCRWLLLTLLRGASITRGKLWDQQGFRAT